MEGIWSESQLDALIESAILGGATDAECMKLVKWATITRVRWVILQEVLRGGRIITVRKSGEPKFAGVRPPPPNNEIKLTQSWSARSEDVSSDEDTFSEILGL